uniref:Lfe109p1 n=1 Tax=Leptospirillum ferrooxidans TaxID=180 RepID=Q7X1M8_9BACT|nr:Lfe109p1 [Leptospirillum ferrooxidans]
MPEGNGRGGMVLRFSTRGTCPFPLGVLSAKNRGGIE